MTENDSLDEYILRHIDPEGEYLHALWRDTQLRLSYGQMASGHLQGRLLRMLVHMVRPRMLLELGTFSGYSALSMAEALEPGAELHTFEIFDEQEDFIRKWFDGSPYASFLHLHIGDALELLPQMDVKWDMAFIDADKRRRQHVVVQSCLGGASSRERFADTWRPGFQHVDCPGSTCRESHPAPSRRTHHHPCEVTFL